MYVAFKNLKLRRLKCRKISAADAITSKLQKTPEITFLE